ncbi:hypothetical protein EJ06DRAFT_559223 [Trichodelitschia bisporula]|uniref:Uncharacterized protein n=1 Tax=Trichodelitschia bisporula TaxID=703511 RepID=A0A6G1HM02_9PEZI|nr:hypothetical protein EJ06DRAFT_559223 [Trichodelitschia bisporula]
MEDASNLLATGRVSASEREAIPADRAASPPVHQSKEEFQRSRLPNHADFTPSANQTSDPYNYPLEQIPPPIYTSPYAPIDPSLFPPPRGPPAPYERQPGVLNWDAFSRLYWPVFGTEADIKVYHTEEGENLRRKSDIYAWRMDPQELHPYADPLHPIAGEHASAAGLSRMVVVLSDIDEFELDLANDPTPEPMVIERRDGGPVTIGDFVSANVRTGDALRRHFYFQDIMGPTTLDPPVSDDELEDEDGNPPVWAVHARKSPELFHFSIALDEETTVSFVRPGSTPGIFVRYTPVYGLP